MKAIIKTKRYRFLRDPISKKTPTYTEWELWIDDELKKTARAKSKFNVVSQFSNSMKKLYNLTEIEILLPEIINLDFLAQRN